MSNDGRVARSWSLAPLLMLTMTVATLVIPGLGVVAPFVLEDLGITRTQFGWLVTSIAAVTAATAPVTGTAVDRLGGRRVVLLLAGAIAVSTVGIAAAPSFAILVAVGMCSGVPNAAGNPATNKIIVERLPVGGRGITMGVKQSGVQLGYLLAGLLLPTLALRVGWRGAFLVLTGFALLVLLLAAWLLPHDPPRTAEHRERRREPLPPDVRWLAVYAVLMGTAGSTVTTFLPLYSHESLGLRATVAGATVSLVGLLGIASRVVLAHAVERLARFPIPLAALAWGSAAAVAVILSADRLGAHLVWPGAFLAGMSVVAWNAIANLAAITTVEPHSAGRASGLVNLGFMSGFTIGPVAFGVLVDLREGTYALAWTCVGVVFLLAAVLMHLWSRTDHRRTRRSGVPQPMR